MGWIIAMAIIVLVLILKFSVRVRLQDDTQLTLGIGILRIRLFPKKEKTLKLSDYEINKFRRRKEKELKKAEKKALKKAEKKQEKSPGKPQKKAGSAANKKEKRDISELVDMIIEVARTFFSRFGRHLHINVKRLHIIVATSDAANTAVLYGAVCGTVRCLIELLYNCANLKLPKNEEISVIPDFTSEKIKAQVDIVFSFRLWQFFDILIRTALTFLKRVINKQFNK